MKGDGSPEYLALVKLETSSLELDADLIESFRDPVCIDRNIAQYGNPQDVPRHCLIF